MNETGKRRARKQPPPKLDVPYICRECGNPTSEREGLVCDDCYKTVFWLIQDYDDD